MKLQSIGCQRKEVKNRIGMEKESRMQTAPMTQKKKIGDTRTVSPIFFAMERRRTN